MELPADHPLRYIKSSAHSLLQRMDDPTWADVIPGSALAEDDEVETSVHVSVSGAQPLVAAADHMQAFTVLIEAGDLENFAAPSTLIRGVIESAAQVVWLLAPNDRSTRVLRSLRLQHEDAQQQVAAHAAAVVLAVDAPEIAEAAQKSEARQRLAELERVGVRHGINLQKARLTSTTVVREASAETGLLWAPWVWRVASGVAHGRPWALLGSSLTEVVDGYIGEGRQRVQMSRDDKVMTGSAVVAWRMLQEAQTLWDNRRRQ